MPHSREDLGDGRERTRARKRNFAGERGSHLLLPRTSLHQPWPSHPASGQQQPPPPLPSTSAPIPSSPPSPKSALSPSKRARPRARATIDGNNSRSPAPPLLRPASTCHRHHPCAWLNPCHPPLFYSPPPVRNYPHLLLRPKTDLEPNSRLLCSSDSPLHQSDSATVVRASPHLCSPLAKHCASNNSRNSSSGRRLARGTSLSMSHHHCHH